jgi:aarF domain-containing kinase
MRGFYLKQAQLLSTRHDFVPKEYMKWIKDTQDNVPSELGPGEAKTYVAKLLKEELNLDFDDVFDEWEETALGIASIGEVHKCRLKKTGQVVALKFQFPGMEQRFRADIRTLKAFCELAMPQHVSGFKEIEKQFTTEFDYRKEAENCKNV